MERGHDELCLISAEDAKYWHFVKSIGHRVDALPLGVLICICPCKYLIFGEKQELIVIVSIKAEMRACNGELKSSLALTDEEAVILELVDHNICHQLLFFDQLSAHSHADF
jgi:hypothetical protein